MLQVMFVESSRKEAYVERFMHSLDPRTIARVIHTLELLEQYGPDLGLPHSKALGNGLFELRVKGRQEIRIFYFVQHGVAYLLHAFQKKTQETPRQEIEKARSRIDMI